MSTYLDCNELLCSLVLAVGSMMSEAGWMCPPWTLDCQPEPVQRMGTSGCWLGWAQTCDAMSNRLR